MKHFAEYVTEKRQAEEERQKKARAAPDDKKNCCVCLSQPVACAFVPCGHLIPRTAFAFPCCVCRVCVGVFVSLHIHSGGHMVTCRPCAGQVENDGCPICRATIAMVLDIFT